MERNYKPPARMGRILVMLADRDTPAPEVSREILVAMVALLKSGSTKPAKHPLNPFYGHVSKAMLSNFDAYGDLHRQLVISESLSTKETIDLDGLSFTFFFEQALMFLQQAMKGAAVSDALQEQVLLRTESLWTANLDQMRRDFAAMGSGAETPPTHRD